METDCGVTGEEDMEWGQPHLLVKGENLFNELGNKERERNQMIRRNRKGSENSENDWRKG